MKFYIAAFCASFAVGFLALGFLMPKADEHLKALESFLGLNGLLTSHESGPAVVFTVSSAKSIVSDAQYFSQVFGVDPSMMRMAKSKINEALVGIDQDRPLGAACYFVNGKVEPSVLIAVPVSNFDQFVESLKAFGSVSRSKLTFQPLGQKQLMIQNRMDYALLSADESAFKLAPENPFMLFKDAADTHRIAIQFYGNRIPERSKKEFLDGFETGFKRSSKKSAELADVDVQAILTDFRDVVCNTNTLFWGIDFDRRRRELVVDFEIEGNDQSRCAKTAKLNQDLAPSKFAGFARDTSAFSAVFHTNVPQEDAESFKNSLRVPLDEFKNILAENFPDGQTEKWAAWADKTLGILQATFASGFLDFGATMEVSDDQMNLAFGASVPDPAEFEAAGKELFQFICKANPTATVRENADEYQGIVFHELVAKPSASMKNKSLPFGSEIKLAIGTAEKEVYLAMGSDPIGTLKKSIDDSSKVSGDLPMLVSNISLSHWSHLMVSDEPQIQVIKKILAGISGKDNVSLKVETTSRGQRMRFQMDTAVFTSARQIVKKQPLNDSRGARKTSGVTSSQSEDSFQRLQRLKKSNGNSSSGSREVGDTEAEFLRRVYSH